MGHEVGAPIGLSAEGGLRPDKFSRICNGIITVPFRPDVINPAALDGKVVARAILKPEIFDPNDIDRSKLSVFTRDGNYLGNLLDQKRLISRGIENVEDLRAWGMNAGVTVVMS